VIKFLVVYVVGFVAAIFAQKIGYGLWDYELWLIVISVQLIGAHLVGRYEN